MEYLLKSNFLKKSVTKKKSTTSHQSNKKTKHNKPLKLDINSYYLKQEEPLRATYLYLRDVIMALDTNITNDLKYGMPFFSYKGKMFCYLWKDKVSREPYIGLVEGNRMNHPSLEKGSRARMKILRIDTNKDIPIEEVKEIINEALDFYRNGIIKTKK